MVPIYPVPSLPVSRGRLCPAVRAQCLSQEAILVFSSSSTQFPGTTLLPGTDLRVEIIDVFLGVHRGGPGPLCPWVLPPLLCPHMVLVCLGAISLGSHPDLSHMGSTCRPQAGTWAVVRPSPQPRCSVNHTAKSVTSGILAGVSENLMKS